MNKLQHSKLICLLSITLCLNANAELTFELDRDLTIGQQPIVPVLPIKGDPQYNIQSHVVTVQTTHGVICNSIESYEPLSNIKLRVLDPNGDNKGDDGVNPAYMGLFSNLSYSLANRSVSVRTENRSKSLCLSSTEFDVIFKDGLDESIQQGLDLNYEFTNMVGEGYAPGSIVAYDVSYQNNTGNSQLLDFIEYHPYTNNSGAYFEPGGNISCDILDINDDVVPGAFCFSSNGVVRDVNLEPTQKIRLSVVRQLSSSSTVGTNLQMMTAVFPKVATIDSFGDNYSFAGFDLEYRLIPVIADN